MFQNQKIWRRDQKVRPSFLELTANKENSPKELQKRSPNKKRTKKLLRCKRLQRRVLKHRPKKFLKEMIRPIFNLKNLWLNLHLVLKWPFNLLQLNSPPQKIQLLHNFCQKLTKSKTRNWKNQKFREFQFENLIF